MPPKSAVQRFTTVTDTTTQVAANLQKWLRENLYLAAEGEGPTLTRLYRIVARELLKGNKLGQEVFFIEVPPKAKDAWCDTAALDVLGRLNAEAATLGGLQRYAVYAYNNVDNEAHLSRFLLKFQAREDEPEEASPDDKSSTTVVATQAMRHAETYMKTLVSSMMSIQAASNGMIDRLGSMVESMMDKRQEEAAMFEDLISKKHERDLATMTAEGKQKAIAAVASRLGLFIPALANKIAGQNVFPVEANATMLMVKALLTSIATDPDRMEKLSQILAPEQMIALVNLFETVSRTTDDAGMPTGNDGNGGNGQSQLDQH